MIPTVLVAGLLVGRAWFVLAAAAGWPLVIVALGAPPTPSLLVVSGALGAVNAAAGVLLHVLLRAALARPRRSVSL